MTTKRAALAVAVALFILAPVAGAQSSKHMITETEFPAADGPVSGADVKLPEGVAPAAAESMTGAVTTTPMPVMIRKVSVLFESTPTGSDIEVDGVYVGSTPLQATLKEGVHHVKISREGHLAWQKSVKAYNGLYVNATLVKESTEKRDVTRSATAQ